MARFPTEFMQQEIQDLLTQIESQHAIKILFACESGSRAWGFPSPDSDFDIRFVYLHPRDWYLSVNEEADSIQVMPSDLLDGSGWDLRKTLRLLGGSNASLFEWLHSPIVYREDAAFASSLRDLAGSHFQPRKSIHHYLGTVASILGREFQGPQVKIKKYFYVLRPVLAARWIVENGTPPPVDFHHLLPLVADRAPVSEAIYALLKAKETAVEGQLVNRSPVLDDFVTAEVARCEQHAEVLSKPETDWAAINDFYRKTLSSH